MSDEQSEPKTASTSRSRGDFLAATGGIALGFTIVPRHVLGCRLYSAQRTGEPRRHRCRWNGGGDIATHAAMARTSLPCATLTTSARPASFNAFPQAKRYKDFRQLIDKEAKNIDAVTVGTPDHIHAVAAMAAIRAGKHVYCQKPLTHTLRECRELTKAAHRSRRRHADGQSRTCQRRIAIDQRVDPVGLDRRSARSPRLVRSRGPAMEARHRSPDRNAASALDLGLELVAWPHSRAPVSSGLCAGQLARVARFRHRGAGGHGLPYHRSPRMGPQTWRTDFGRGHATLDGSVLKETSRTSRLIRSRRSSPTNFPARPAPARCA